MFTGEENHWITFEKGAESTKRYRVNHPHEIKGGYFSKQCIQDLLDQPDCVGIRIYFGNSSEGKPELIIVGVNSSENDLIGEDYYCMDTMIPCPDSCGDNNILNSNM
jgi:hypothetical protein